jgi:hypothetical protein
VLRSAVHELARAGIIGDLPEGVALPFYGDARAAAAAGPGSAAAAAAAAAAASNGDAMATDAAGAAGGGGARLEELGRLLWAAAAEADGFSGRTLRKLPFLAHAAGHGLPAPCGAAAFLAALRAAAARERADRSELTTG